MPGGFCLRQRTVSPWALGLAASLVSALVATTGCGVSELDATKALDDGQENPTVYPPLEMPEEPDSMGGSGDGGSPPVVPPENPAFAPAATLTVSAGKLRDHCGAPVLLRGVSEMVVWADLPSAQGYIREIAQTGANALRVVWLSDGDPLLLSTILDSVRAEKLIALVEFHDRNDLELGESMDQMVAGWTDPAMVATLVAHQKSILVELGTGIPRQPTPEWETVFVDALARLRQAGLTMPIAVRAPVWQNGFDTAVTALSKVVESDPLGNTLVATFFWTGAESVFADAHRAIIDAGMVPFIAEFSGYRSGVCPLQSTDTASIMSFSQELSVGWFAWSWGGIPNAPCPQFSTDMTTDGTLAGLVGWGKDVALADPNGISRTSVPLATWDATSCSE